MSISYSTANALSASERGHDLLPGNRQHDGSISQDRMVMAVKFSDHMSIRERHRLYHVPYVSFLWIAACALWMVEKHPGDVCSRVLLRYAYPPCHENDMHNGG